ncbi:hypothetical protein BDZ94DRAFT_746855 [Collybia nuda]|uniref:Uncharacterized protein n=1 Tax=Collybia nuda TaxID=64659 RepID=A0A9P5Y2J7_9AGAR|nr:hypothetical protein BDZ94DRAFT_746855 [Collybia nuda]
MLRSINSPSDSHNDDHLRHLLDQRTTRAGRFSAISELSDTPSVYSRPYFSPRPLDRELRSVPADSQYNSPISPGLGAQTNRDRLNDPAASILDLDDSRSSISSSDAYDDDEQPTVDDDDDDDDDEPLPRMSLLGPKMRFHSRAPWELDDDALQEEEEPEYGTLLPKKGFGLSSPRASTSRPSGESARSQVRSKKSFETTSSQVSYPRGALYALAQESLSTSALGPSLTSIQKSSRGKFSLGRVRPESPKPSLPPSPISSSKGGHSPAHTHLYTTSPNRGQEVSNTNNFQLYENSSSHSRPSYSDEDVHPYANPDLVMSYVEDNSHYPRHNIARSDSITTVTDSVIASSLTRTGKKATLDPNSNMVVHRDRISALHGKEISSPIIGFNGTLRSEPAQISDDHRSLAPPQATTNLSGWNDRVTPPTFALISLEEARAQRLRSATVNPEISRPPQLSSTTDFPDFEKDMEKKLEYPDGNLSPVTSRGRARSISAGAKAKHAIQNIVAGVQPRLEKSDSDVGVTQNGGLPGKTLKHKKSGFMRLFNGGRAHEKEERVLPPPVPSLSDGFAAYNAQQATQKNTKHTTYRIPVPELAPAFIENSESRTESSSVAHTSTYSKPISGSRRVFPPLSINTIPWDQPDRGPLSAVEDLSFQTRTLPNPNCLPEKPWLNESTPQSAPANITEFPALKLRPVSTTFSAQFGDHIVGKDPRPSLETDISTPSPSNNVFSPITPDSSIQTDHTSSDKLTPHFAPVSSDQASIIQLLQDQIVSSKRAWQRHISELEGEIRDLKAEVEDLRSTSQVDYCDVCGRGKRANGDTSVSRQHSDNPVGIKNSVVHRPRARTGTASRFGSAVS